MIYMPTGRSELDTIIASSKENAIVQIANLSSIALVFLSSYLFDKLFLQKQKFTSSKNLLAFTLVISLICLYLLIDVFSLKIFLITQIIIIYKYTYNEFSLNGALISFIFDVFYIVISFVIFNLFFYRSKKGKEEQKHYLKYLLILITGIFFVKNLGFLTISIMNFEFRGNKNFNQAFYKEYWIYTFIGFYSLLSSLTVISLFINPVIEYIRCKKAK
ncbi:hypothetical protein [Mycoplasmopsis columboralis]|nr:hypothetical protein [Mycoplasmopsis columboralis]